MKNAFNAFCKVVFWALSLVVLLAFLGAIVSLWNDTWASVTLVSPISLLLSWWESWYFVLIILVVAAFVWGVRSLPQFRKRRFIMFGVVAGLALLVIPYLHDRSWAMSSSEGVEIERVTTMMAPTVHPAVRLRQFGDSLLDGGCQFWLERWSEDGRYLRLSERPYGARHCFTTDEVVYDRENKAWLDDFSGINFLERPWSDRRTRGTENLLSQSHRFEVIDALPSPETGVFAVVIGESQYFGPQEVVMMAVKQ